MGAPAVPAGSSSCEVVATIGETGVEGGEGARSGPSVGGGGAA